MKKKNKIETFNIISFYCFTKFLDSCGCIRPELENMFNVANFVSFSLFVSLD